jgi:hypothetical protein
MIQKVEISPSHSLVLVMDADTGEIPESLEGGAFVATPSSVAIGTLSQQDGKTTVAISDERANIEIDSSLHCIFIGAIATPRKLISVCTVLLEEVLSVPVRGTSTSLELWTNRSYEPSKIYVLFDSGVPHSAG